MLLENYIRIYDNCLPVENISTLIQWINKKGIENKGLVGNSKLNEDIRKVKLFDFYDWNDIDKTKIHWCNYLYYTFYKCLMEYSKTIFPYKDVLARRLTQIDLLKYEEGGFYIPHIDHYDESSRTLSFILILNNDYEGGELDFHNPTTGQPYKKIKANPGSIVVWPSNFLYTHSVNPVTKGTRYSVVAWAL